MTTSKFETWLKVDVSQLKNSLEATQRDGKIKCLKKINIDSHKKFIRTNKLILKTQQRFKSELKSFYCIN